MNLSVSNIRPYPKNAKKHPRRQIEQIAASIKEFGFNQPIVIDRENTVIVGHGRLEAAKLLGLEDVPAIQVNLTEEQAKAYRLADNKLNESEWDIDLVIEELKGLSELMIDLTGFEKDLLIEADERDDVIPENAPPIAKLGDLWALGEHRVLCGDSTDKEAVERLMDGKKADMIFTDPPYNVVYEGMQNSKQWDKIENDAMTPEAFKEFLLKVFVNYHTYSKGEAAIYICHADKSHTEFRSSFEEAGYDWRVTIIWIKNSPAFNFAQYKYKHEPIFYCYKKGHAVGWFGDRTNNTVWKEDWTTEKIVRWFKNVLVKEQEIGKTTVWEEKKERGDHPTIKPIELIQRAIRNSSKEDDLIADFFLGSGSTLIAAEKTGRICYGMELEPKYVDVIIKRWEDYTGKNAEKING